MAWSKSRAQCRSSWIVHTNNSVKFDAILSKCTIAQRQFRLNQTNFVKFCATIAIEYNFLQWNVLNHNALGSKVHFGAQYIALHMLHNALSAFGTGCIEVHWLHWKVHFWLVHWIAIVQCSALGSAFLAHWPDCNGLEWQPMRSCFNSIYQLVIVITE